MDDSEHWLVYHATGVSIFRGENEARRMAAPGMLRVRGPFVLAEQQAGAVEDAARCQHCPNLADERSYMCEDCAAKADEELQSLHDEVQSLRQQLQGAVLAEEDSRYICAEGRTVSQRAVTAGPGCDDFFHDDDGSLCRHIKAAPPPTRGAVSAPERWKRAVAAALVCLSGEPPSVDPHEVRMAIGAGSAAMMEALDDDTVTLAVRAVDALQALGVALEAHGLSRTGAAAAVTGMTLTAILDRP